MPGTEARPHGRLAPQRALEQFRSELPWLVAQIASAIQAEVPAYAGGIGGERRFKIETALRFGLREFAEYSAGKARLDIGVASCFKHLGWSEGFDGQTTEALRGAFNVAAREVWAALHRITLDQGLTVLVLGRLGDALFGMSAKLWVQVEDGYRVGQTNFDDSRDQCQAKLARCLLGDESVGDLETLADNASWQLPPSSLVVCAEAPERVSDLESELSQAGAFVFVDEALAVAVCDVSAKAEVLDCFVGLISDVPVTISPPAQPSQLVDAVKLALRAHLLIYSHVIPCTQIVDCSQHKIVLWLQSEPLLRDLIVDEMLTPFDGLTSRRRTVLATTMVAWLEHGRTAPAVAKQLGVHPQTVRYRLQQLKVLMGHRLDDPEAAFQTLMALKAILPLWTSTSG